MEYLKEYIAPELLVLIPVLYLIGMGLKKSSKVSDNLIPLILGATGIALAAIYLIPEKGMGLATIFMSITQGVLCVGASVYVNQLIKQGGKP